MVSGMGTAESHPSDSAAPPGSPWPAVVGAAARPALCETHSGLVVFVGERAYKFKKATAMGFLDFSTEAARADACRHEVELNRRLAPDVYLGVASLLDDEGQVFDHAVVMRRLPAERSLQRCLVAGEDVTGALEMVAHQLATLHAASPPARRWAGVASAASLRGLWGDALKVLRTAPGIDLAKVSALEVGAEQYLLGREPLFSERQRRGRVVEGHGDLQAADIFLLPEGPRILDCLEFDESLRWSDGLLDAAFLAMDLERLGRPDLSKSFLAGYGDLAGDHWPSSLAHHHVAYRAAVRAKVGVIRAGQVGQDPGPEVAQHLDIAVRHLELAQCRLTLLGGLPGTGKTTLATSLGESTGAVVLSSDEARDDLLGDPHGPTEVDQGRYRPELRRAVYDRLLEEGRLLLSHGEHVILDASWADAGDRDRARTVAESTSSTLRELCCTLAPEVSEQRIRQRLDAGGSRSEATPDVARAMARRFDPWPEAQMV